MATTCCEEVYDRVSHRFYPCGAAGKVCTEGQWYCGRHSPASKAARIAKRDAYWNAQATQRKEQADKEAKRQQLLDVLDRFSITTAEHLEDILRGRC